MMDKSVNIVGVIKYKENNDDVEKEATGGRQIKHLQ